MVPRRESSIADYANWGIDSGLLTRSHGFYSWSAMRDANTKLIGKSIFLRCTGYCPTGPLGLICLAGIPRGLDAEETQMYLRENGASLGGLGSPIRVDSGARWAQDTYR
jgi:hypothetical protein